MDFLKQVKKKPKEIRGFSIDENIYADFRDECKNLNISMSSIIQEFLKRAVLLLKSGKGGEVVFGIEGTNWKQPQKIIYDGKEITERDGVRQIDNKKTKEENKKK